LLLEALVGFWEFRVARAETFHGMLGGIEGGNEQGTVIYSIYKINTPAKPP
jgi:hypothetical protein